MLDINLISTLLGEDESPTLSAEQLNALATLYDNINLACYMGCKMKAKVNKLKIGSIEIESNSSYWLDLADTFYAQYMKSPEFRATKSRSGLCIGRSDEL